MIYWLSFISVKELEEESGLSHDLFYIPHGMRTTTTPADTMSLACPVLSKNFLERIVVCIYYLFILSLSVS